MLSSINPFGERARGQRYWLTTVTYLVGSILGGAALGLVLGLGALILQPLVPASPVPALAVLSIAAVWDLFGLPVPSIHRQVDEKWLPRFRGWVYGLGFGLQLGIGFSTYVTTALTYGLALAVIVTGEPRIAILGGLVFGSVRGISLFTTAGINHPDDLRVFFRGFERLRIVTRTTGALVVIAVTALSWSQVA